MYEILLNYSLLNLLNPIWNLVNQALLCLFSCSNDSEPSSHNHDDNFRAGFS